MKCLALVLVFCAFVSLSDSACFTDLLKRGAKQCVDRYDKSRHPVGSKWINGECVSCTCSPGRMQCCNAMGHVTSITKGCIVKPVSLHYGSVAGLSKHRYKEMPWVKQTLRCTLQAAPDYLNACGQRLHGSRMGRAFLKTEGCIVKYDYKTCTFDVFHPEDR
ncbi:hypothetical protein Q8A67_010428 [Cirrhinus molitorella]|uniref:Beta-microseminoprotein n=1 Tax=Cirrhinus molitorella TaxID=172907 RepID=A0AA88TPA2_9TELE|nr:hypothetical protein Q8A67_010428 [Cirrhinus molitorella]